jgi:hypothetical protein
MHIYDIKKINENYTENGYALAKKKKKIDTSYKDHQGE